MKAIVQDRYGSSDALELREIPVPEAGVTEVLLRVRAAGVNRGTLHVMAGEPYLMRLMGFGLRKPKNPVSGQDVAGTVVAIGDGVERFQVGDEVFGIAKGSFAEYAVASADKLATKPDGLGFEGAAVMAVSGLTALQAVDVGEVAAGSTVLVVGASGGVGTYAVQLAVARGAIVTGVASGSKADLVVAAGATHVVDYSRADFTEGTHRYDVILDIGGMTSIARLRRALTARGTLVIVGGENGSTWSPGMGRQLKAAAVSPFVGQRLTSILNKEHHSGLERLAEMTTTTGLTSFVERSYPLAEAARAVRQLEEGRVRGKLAITP